MCRSWESGSRVLSRRLLETHLPFISRGLMVKRVSLLCPKGTGYCVSLVAHPSSIAHRQRHRRPCLSRRCHIRVGQAILRFLAPIHLPLIYVNNYVETSYYLICVLILKSTCITEVDDRFRWTLQHGSGILWFDVSSKYLRGIEKQNVISTWSIFCKYSIQVYYFLTSFS